MSALGVAPSDSNAAISALENAASILEVAISVCEIAEPLPSSPVAGSRAV